MSARGYSTESPEHSAKSPGGRVTCPRCKAVVSTPGSFIAGASCCEKCGYSLRRRSDKSYLLVVSIVLIIVSVIALIVLLQPVIE